MIHKKTFWIDEETWSKAHIAALSCGMNLITFDGWVVEQIRKGLNPFPLERTAEFKRQAVQYVKETFKGKKVDEL